MAHLNAKCAIIKRTWRESVLAIPFKLLVYLHGSFSHFTNGVRISISRNGSNLSKHLLPDIIFCIARKSNGFECKQIASGTIYSYFCQLMKYNVSFAFIFALIIVHSLRKIMRFRFYWASSQEKKMKKKRSLTRPIQRHRSIKYLLKINLMTSRKMVYSSCWISDSAHMLHTTFGYTHFSHNNKYLIFRMQN